jgi:hypothetical protein
MTWDRPIYLPDVVAAYGTTAFETVLIRELNRIESWLPFHFGYGGEADNVDFDLMGCDEDETSITADVLVGYEEVVLGDCQAHPRRYRAQMRLTITVNKEDGRVVAKEYDPEYTESP